MQPNLSMKNSFKLLSAAAAFALAAGCSDYLTGGDLSNDPNRPVTATNAQLFVYDALQTLLSTAIVNMQKTGGTNFGPASADLVYSGDLSKYVTLAHTLKARFYMHTAEVRPGAYAQALTEAAQGIKGDSGN